MRNSYASSRFVLFAQSRSTLVKCFLIAMSCVLFGSTFAMADTKTYTNDQITSAPDIPTGTYNPTNFVINGDATKETYDFKNKLSGNGVVNYTGKDSSHRLVLSGDNSGFTGTFNAIANPDISGAQAVFHLTSTTAGSASATWNLGDSTFLRASLTTDGTVQLGALTGTGRVRSDGSSANVTVTLEIGGANKDATFAGLIENSWWSGNTFKTAVTKVGSGVQTFTGANTYTGETKIRQGILRLTGDGTLGSATSDVLISSSQAGYYATLDLAQDSGTVTFSRNLKSSDAGAEAGAQWSGNITKTGNATINFTGKITNSGLAVSAGTLNLGTSEMANTNAMTLGYLKIGNGSTVNYYGGTGSLTLSDKTTHVVGNTDSGTGTLNIYSGTVKSNKDLYIGSGSSTANGFVTVKNGAKLEATSLHVGGYGNGQLTIETGGTVTTSKG